MSDDAPSDAKRAGTYLFVKARTARPSKPAAPGKAAARPTRSLPAVGPLLVETAAHAPPAPAVRYIRPQLRPEGLDPRLVFFLEPDAPVAEQYRAAAAELMAAQPAPRRVWITSAEDATGKTLTTINLGSAIAETGRVMLVDLGLGSPGLAQAFGLQGSAGLRDALRARQKDRRAPIDVLLVGDQLGALPSGNEDPADAFAPADLGRVLEEVADAADLVLLDGPSLDTPGARETLPGWVDAVLLVVSPSDLESGRFDDACATLEGVRILGAVINGAPG